MQYYPRLSTSLLRPLKPKVFKGFAVFSRSLEPYCARAVGLIERTDNEARHPHRNHIVRMPLATIGFVFVPI